MKISLMTIWHCGNYGAEMQTYATVKALRKLGHDVEVLDFRLFESNHSLRSIVGRFLNAITPAQRTFKKFWKKYIKNISCHYHNVAELRNNPPKSDVYLVGSDQVWNEDITGDRSAAYLLDFGGENVKRISYASSIGVSEWNFSQSYPEMASKQFKKFVALSCREITGANVLSQKFNLNVKQVLDPTLLHQDYKEITGFIQETKNLVFYPLSVDDTSAVSFCKELATKLNLKYVNANPYTFIPFLPIIWKRNSIAQWMSAIGGASLVVTGSFHGLAFSLIYHRQFILINDNKQGRNSRMMDLLNYLGLEHRLFRTTEEAMASRVWEDTIDYQLIDEKLNQARNESWNYLKQSLS